MERLTKYNEKVKKHFFPYCFREDTCAGMGCEKPDCEFIEKVCERLGQYEDIGTVEECKALKEKAEPKKIKPRECDNCDDDDGCIRCIMCDRHTNRCPNCENSLENNHSIQHKYCPECGQKIDWT